MKVDELKALLEDEGIEIPEGAKKGDLKALVEQHGLAPDEPEVEHHKTRHAGNISMDILLTMADGSTHESNITIHNPRGCMPASQLSNPDYIFGTVKKEVADRFGIAHVK